MTYEIALIIIAFLGFAISLLVAALLGVKKEANLDRRHFESFLFWHEKQKPEK